MANQSDLEKECREIESLREGKRVLCRECHEGYYAPFNTDNPSQAHTFICDKCGARVRFEPVVDTEWMKPL